MESVANMVSTLTPIVTEPHNISEVTEQRIRFGGPAFSVIIKVVYAVGIVGNGAAIVALRRGSRRLRNRKHLLLLTALAVNDLVALVGMVVAMIVSERGGPAASSARSYCAARVLLRVFGVGSVCIAVVMAVERYLALTSPFLYQKKVTHKAVFWWVVLAWGIAAAATSAPLAGLGAYYDETGSRCLRYRDAEASADRIYAYAYVAFGTALCAALVYCNAAVSRAVCAGRSAPAAPRRDSRRSCRALDGAHSARPHNAATREERAFTRLMTTLSVLFMLCWLPQMITSAVHLTAGSQVRASLRPFAAAADLLMLLNYVFNPVLYVLTRRFSYTQMCRALGTCCRKSHKSSTESVKTSCCVQETFVVSDSSGESRPLRSLRPDPY